MTTNREIINQLVLKCNFLNEKKLQTEKLDGQTEISYRMQSIVVKNHFLKNLRDELEDVKKEISCSLQSNFQSKGLLDDTADLEQLKRDLNIKYKKLNNSQKVTELFEKFNTFIDEEIIKNKNVAHPPAVAENEKNKVEENRKVDENKAEALGRDGGVDPLTTDLLEKFKLIYQEKSAVNENQEFNNVINENIEEKLDPENPQSIIDKTLKYQEVNESIENTKSSIGDDLNEIPDSVLQDKTPLRTAVDSNRPENIQPYADQFSKSRSPVLRSLGDKLFFLCGLIMLAAGIALIATGAGMSLGIGLAAAGGTVAVVALNRHRFFNAVKGSLSKEAGEVTPLLPPAQGHNP